MDRRPLGHVLQMAELRRRRATSCSIASTSWCATPDRSGFYYESIDLFDASIRRPSSPTA